MFGGGGGLNPRKMQQMMEQMGIDLDELDAESVIIRLRDDTELYFEAPDVTRMDARGQQTYQIVGEPTERESTEADAGAGAGADADVDPSDVSTESGVPDSDVEIVIQRTGASAEDARSALEATDGDLAAAISRLE